MLLVFAGTHIAVAQAPPPAGAPPQGPAIDKETLGKLFDQYATITAGWYLEQKCNHLSPELKKEFEWDVAQTNIAMSQRADPSFLMKLQQAGRKTAADQHCDAKSQDVVTDTLVMARRTTLFLTGTSYSPAAAASYDLQRVFVLWLGQKMDDQCKIMPKDIRAEFDSRVAEITRALTAAAGDEPIKRMRTAADEAYAKRNVSCSPMLEPALKEQFAVARQMTPGWKAK